MHTELNLLITHLKHSLLNEINYLILFDHDLVKQALRSIFGELQDKVKQLNRQERKLFRSSRYNVCMMLTCKKKVKKYFKNFLGFFSEYWRLQDLYNIRDRVQGAIQLGAISSLPHTRKPRRGNKTKIVKYRAVLQQSQKQDNYSVHRGCRGTGCIQFRILETKLLRNNPFW